MSYEFFLFVLGAGPGAFLSIVLALVVLSSGRRMDDDTSDVEHRIANAQNIFMGDLNTRGKAYGVYKP